MYLIYSKNGSPIVGLEGKYRNPDYFRGCEKGVSKVTVEKGFEDIAEQYREIGVEVTVHGADAGKGTDDGKNGSSKGGKTANADDGKNGSSKGGKTANADDGKNGSSKG